MGAMPLIVLALGAYLTGLLAGFTIPVAVALFVAGAAILAGSILGLARLATMGLLAAAGAFIAYTDRVGDADCVRRALVMDTFLVRLDDAAGPGAYVRGQLARCDARIALAVERGRAAAGSTVLVRGEPLPSARGILVQRATLEVQSSAGVLARWRTAAGDAIDRVFRSDAPLSRALLIADMRGLSPELRDRFATAGMAHILSISGLHVGLIAVALELVLQLCSVNRRRAALLSLSTITLYVAVIGFPAPAVRSAVMLGATIVSRLAQRPTSPWAVLALGAVQPVWAPPIVTDLGYQLSVLGVAALIAASKLTQRFTLSTLPRWGRSLVVAMVATSVATLASAPLVAWTFGRVSVIAPISNLFAAPIIGLAQPMLFLGMVLAPILPVARWVGDAVHPLLAALDSVAAVSASIPNAALTTTPSPWSAVVAGIACTAILVACASRDWTRPALIAAASIAALVWKPLAPSETALVELHMIDIGQGDAIGLRTAHGRWVLFDAGRGWATGDAGRATVIPYIARRGGTLDMFVLSHPHTDHVGGAASVIRALHPARYVDAGFPGSADAYRASLLAARSMHTRWQRAHPGDSVDVDGVMITFLAPDSAWTAALTDPNLASVVTLVRVGDVRILLTGDAEGPEEDWLVEHERDRLPADILKVAHHGSSTSTTPAFLAAVQPRLALVSVGAGNSYGHPNGEILRGIAAAGAQVLRTDRVGSIVARTDGRRLFVDAGGDQWELPPRSTR
jgi:competence protein ComEC